MDLKPYQKYELNLFTTKKDKTTSNIYEMSNYLGRCFEQQLSMCNDVSDFTIIKDISLADLAILNEVISTAISFTNRQVNFIPDFEHLPTAILEKLKKRLYKLGLSKQVDGNYRPVILDENGVRIKDITLKKVLNNVDYSRVSRDLLNQLQMKQISDELSAIQQLQDYQIERDRDRDIKTPFLNARQYIVQAQNAKLPEDRKRYLEKACEYLTAAINGTFTDIATTSREIDKCNAHPLAYKQENVDKFISYLAADIDFATKFTGVHMFVQNYLGNEEDAIMCLDRYYSVMDKLQNEKMEKSKLTAIELLQDNTVYNQNNRDGWFNLSQKMIPVLACHNNKVENKATYLISVEDA